MTVSYIYGPSFGGKTEYVREHARPNDLVLDRTTLAHAFHPFAYPPPLSNAVHRAWPFLIHRIVPLMADRNAWIIETGPRFQQRKRWRDVIDQSILIDPGIEECRRRCRENGDADWPLQTKMEWINLWYERYNPDLTMAEERDQHDRKRIINKRLTVDTPIPSTPSREW